MTTLYISPLSFIPQWFTNVGLMAGGGTVNTYQAGTTIPVTTYTDSTGLVANPNPMSLSSSGRPVAASGTPVAFWAPSGTVLKFVVSDIAGNQLDALDNVALLNDPAASSSLQALLASAASSNASGVGPVAGVDLVANAIKSYDTFADVRAANQPVLVSGQTLNIQVQGAATVNDGLGGDFYWNAASTDADNGATVLKPNTLSGAGRWLRLYTPTAGAQGTIASATSTDLGTVGSNVVLITGITNIDSFGSSASLAHPLYFLTFNGILVLINNAALILPGGAAGIGQIQTAAGDSAVALYLGSGNWQMLSYTRALSPQNCFNVAGQAVTSSTALVNITGLSAVLAATACYLIQLRLQLFGTGGTAQGYKVQATFSGTVDGFPVGTGVAVSDGTPTAVVVALNGTLTESAVVDVSTSTADMVSIDYIILTASAGTMNAQFAQASSSANATNIQAGSAMIVTRIF